MFIFAMHSAQIVSTMQYFDCDPDFKKHCFTEISPLKMLGHVLTNEIYGEPVNVGVKL